MENSGAFKTESMNGDLLKQQGYDLMAAAFEVHREQGGGLLEEIYQESLEKELSIRGLSYEAKRHLPVFYKGFQLQKTYVPDLILLDELVVELKAVKELSSEHEAQLLNYLRLTRLRIGYLINFGPIRRVEWKRYVLTDNEQPLHGHSDRTHTEEFF